MATISKTAVTISLDEQFNMPTFARYPVSFISGEGPFLFSEEGETYLDMLSGIGVNALGHANPEIAAIYSDQAARLIHISNLYHSPVRAELEKKLVELSGQSMQVFLSNSGAEANECAIKLARRWGAKNNNAGVILTLENSFHGRTLAATAATGNDKKAQLYKPVLPGFKHIAPNDLDALEEAFEQAVLAFLCEPILGEAGVYELSEAYLKRAQELCEEHNALLIIDEVQTGLARTGSLFAHQYFGIVPDMFTLGKALGNGFPIAATLAKKEIAKAFEPGDHGTTMGGNPLGCAVSLRVLDLIEELNLSQAAIELGSYFRRALLGIPQIKEVRGRGLMIGLSIKAPKLQSTKMLAFDLLNNQKILVNSPNDVDLRLLPPLIISTQDIDSFIDALTRELDKYEGEK